jgi:hypothetical protein
MGRLFSCLKPTETLLETSTSPAMIDAELSEHARDKLLLADTEPIPMGDCEVLELGEQVYEGLAQPPE